MYDNDFDSLLEALPQLANVREVADLLRCSPKDVYEKYHSGYFPGAFKLGGVTSSIMFPRAAIRRFLLARAEAATAEPPNERAAS